LIRLSYLAADYPEILELDINPLLVTPTEVIALDARIAIDKNAQPDENHPFAHLALHPYPEKLVRTVRLNETLPLVLRPIKPEDESLWLEMIGRCSKESLYSRFRYFFQWLSHETATRFCFNDYDREIAIVAELNEDGNRKLLGVGRLIADPDHETAEYAILIEDAWQKKDLGNLITDYCIEIAKSWKLKRFVAQTTTDNKRMISVFRKRDFEISINSEDSTVDVAREL
jgi:acetyltransferase